MKVVLLSDTHAVLDPRVEALAVGADLVLHAGDVGSAAVLERLGDRVRAVLGNNDTAAKWQGAARRRAQLRAALTVELPGGTVAVEHGHRANPAGRRHAKLRARYPTARLVVYGHSHRLVIDQDDDPWVANPGAAGRARTHGGPSCIVLTATARRWHLAPHRFAPA